jgi:hypothetical protein
MIKVLRVYRAVAGCGIAFGLLASLGLPPVSATMAADELPMESVLPASMALEALQSALAHCAADGYAVGVAIVDRAGVVRAVARGGRHPPWLR